MTDITELAQREKFEAWFKSSFHPDKTGPYIKDQLYFAWKAAGAEMVEALEYYKSREERVTSLVRDNSKSWDELYRQVEAKGKRNVELVEALEKAQQRIDELESRTVKMPHRNLGHPKLFLLCPFPYYDAEDMEKALAAAGIKVEAE
ncbi:hypothetical protein OZ386_001835 [Klebsiella pneumoniae]